LVCTTNTASRIPRSFGWKVTETVQTAPAGMVMPLSFAQPVTVSMANSGTLACDGDTVMVLMVSVALTESTTSWVGAFEPNAVDAKFTGVSVFPLMVTGAREAVGVCAQAEITVT
jgi:hypothetical protein